MSQRQSRFDQDDNVVVMKFGGTSVEDEAAIRRLIAIVQSRSRNQQPVVVVSALARVTDQLLEAGRDAANGRLGAALAAVRDIYVRHERLADSLVGESAYGALDRQLRSDFRALESLLLEVEAAGKLNLKSQDQLLGFGEVFSSRLVKEALYGSCSGCRACRRANLHHHRCEARAGKSRLGRDQRKPATGACTTASGSLCSGPGRIHFLDSRRSCNHSWSRRIGFHCRHCWRRAPCIAGRNLD